MIRRIVQIDKEKCNGCGACASACHEGAIGMVNGKAQLLKDEYCDGLGDCLPACPADAITFVEREATAYDEQAVKQNKAAIKAHLSGSTATSAANETNACNKSELKQWPCQIKLVPIEAKFFNGANLLVAADCTAYAYANIHADFMKSRITLIGCPKLDGVDYSIKFAEIIKSNDISSITLLRMNVPCCRGLELAINRAIENSGKSVDFKVVVISKSGDILS